ncbi:MAG: hypothetical protein WCO60_10200 [Verrucomicrobiota bacterium]
MINLSNEMPTLQLGSGVVAIEARWLEQSLVQAAAAAGYPQWLPAQDIAKTVTAHLMAKSTRDPVSLEGFALTVRGVLEGVGYGEVAPFFLKSGLELGVSLLDVAERTMPGFELGFFRECEGAMDRVFACEVLGRLSFVDLVPAVKQVMQAKRWSRSCEFLRGEIVAFIRSQVAKRATREELIFSIY